MYIPHIYNKFLNGNNATMIIKYSIKFSNLSLNIVIYIKLSNTSNTSSHNIHIHKIISYRQYPLLNPSTTTQTPN